jgi:hypothetical protein
MNIVAHGTAVHLLLSYCAVTNALHYTADGLRKYSSLDILAITGANLHSVSEEDTADNGDYESFPSLKAIRNLYSFAICVTTA